VELHYGLVILPFGAVALFISFPVLLSQFLQQLMSRKLNVILFGSRVFIWERKREWRIALLVQAVLPFLFTSVSCMGNVRLRRT
jgi:hypothetical protein